MRTITEYDAKPKAKEVIEDGKRATVFVRQDIHEETEEIVDEGGETVARTYWTATEYSTQVNALNLNVDSAFIEKLIEAETEAEAVRVRTRRNELLDMTDKEMTIDRIEREDPETVAAWKSYRQALRDVPEQPGFPFDVVWPEKP